ncbi:MAG: TonB-dependent receptor [Gallionella sp.]
MNQKLMSVVLFGAIAFPLAALAKPTSLGEIVVTATRLPQPLNKTIADTTVINAQAIRASGAPDVPTLLRSLTGIEVAQQGGMGKTSGVFMRGTNSNQVLVLLDGVRINSATTGATALDQIMLSSIERIEVVRGNVSSLYGSQAIGGVIQLFTKQGHGAPAFNVSAGIGNQGTRRMAAGFSGKVNNTSFSVNAGRVKTDGVSALNPKLAPKANPNKNGYDNTTFDGQIKHTINQFHVLSATLFSTRGNNSYDNAYGVPTDRYTSISKIDKLSLASDDQISEYWHSQVRLAQGVDDIISYRNGLKRSALKTRSNQLTWQNNFKISEAQHLTISAEHLVQRVSSTRPFSQNTRKVNSVLGGYTGEFGAQQVQLNLRQDRYSDFGTANTGLLGYGVSLSEGWRATASVSNAFKAPTFNDMYYPLSFGYKGNLNLKPERSVNKEAGLHYASNTQRIDFVYFDNRISDLISGNKTFTTVINVNKARIKGQELSYAGVFGHTHLKANLTFQNPRNAATGIVLGRRAKEFGNFSVSQDFDAWNVAAEVRYSGVRQDGVHTLAAYQLLNLTSRYQIDKHLHLSARVGNLFNRRYSEVYRYNTLGRTVFVGLTYQQ